MNGGAVLVFIGVWVLTQVTKGHALSRLGVLPTSQAAPDPVAPDPSKPLPGSGIDPKTLKPLPLRSGGGGVF